MAFRTELRRFVSGSIEDPFNVRFSIIACRDGVGNTTRGYGGFQGFSVEARKMDEHYLLMKGNTIGDFTWEPFGIVELNKPEEALERMYEEAKRLGERRAIFDKNKLVDLTR